MLFLISANYSAARSRLTDAEHTSHLESEEDINKPRKKISKSIRLLGESSSDDEVFEMKHKKYKQTKLSQKQHKKKLINPLPSPPAPLQREETEESQSVIISPPMCSPKLLDGQSKSSKPNNVYCCFIIGSILN